MRPRALWTICPELEKSCSSIFWVCFWVSWSRLGLPRVFVWLSCEGHIVVRLSFWVFFERSRFRVIGQSIFWVFFEYRPKSQCAKKYFLTIFWLFFDYFLNTHVKKILPRVFCQHEPEKIYSGPVFMNRRSAVDATLYQSSNLNGVSSSPWRRGGGVREEGGNVIGHFHNFKSSLCTKALSADLRASALSWMRPRRASSSHSEQ